jgi:hypothetical protein
MIEFDQAYGDGANEIVLEIINALAPLTRRDEWWLTEGPKEMIGQVLVKYRVSQ